LFGERARHGQKKLKKGAAGKKHGKNRRGGSCRQGGQKEKKKPSTPMGSQPALGEGFVMEGNLAT